MNKEKQVEQGKSVATEFILSSYRPYKVVIKIDGRSKRIAYGTKLFATIRAKKVGKLLKVKPNLSFEPRLG